MAASAPASSRRDKSPGRISQLGRSYAKILQQANERKLALALPTREVYVKGPGMIFKGNPKNYLTEIQLPFKD